MKIIRKTRDGGGREALLKEYSLSASLISLLKRAGEETARTISFRQPDPVLVRVRR